MTTLTTSVPTTEDRLRTVLRADAVLTAAFGVTALETAGWYGGPSWVARAVGAVLLLVAVEMAVLSRSHGRRLRLSGLVVAEAAFAWVVGSLLVAGLVDMDAAGREVLLLSAVASLGFGIAETRLARALR